MFLVFVVSAFLFLCGLCILMWTEAKSTRRNEAAVGAMFSKKRR